MISEKSAGAVIFRRENGIKFLLLKYKFKSEYWDFPRGNIEKGERAEDTARREIEEETGIKDLRFLKNFEQRVKWFYRRNGNLVSKEVIYFLAETEQEKIELSEENVGYEWLSYEEALNRLKPNSQKVLREAMKFLSSSLMAFKK
jgi:8-oxo-dGTP pyrophosphatase MutT (NUDIX family)